jgi:hypothetical protein
MSTTAPGYPAGASTRDLRERTSVRRTFTETKAFYKTSEFIVWALTVIGVLVVTYVNDSTSLSNWHGWLLITVLSSAYMFSRGIAKAATREPYTDDRDT